MTPQFGDVVHVDWIRGSRAVVLVPPQPMEYTSKSAILRNPGDVPTITIRKGQVAVQLLTPSDGSPVGYVYAVDPIELREVK